VLLIDALDAVARRSAPIPNYGNSSPERGARIARRDDREYREYSRKEQRSEHPVPQDVGDFADHLVRALAVVVWHPEYQFDGEVLQERPERQHHG
jgi:hypothetical protein